MQRIKPLPVFALFTFAIGVCPAAGQKAQVAQTAQTLTAAPQSQTDCKPGSTEQPDPQLYRAMVAPRKPSAATKAQVRLVCVPDYSRMTLGEAQQAIGQTQGLHFESAVPNDLRGVVASQTPLAGHYAIFGTGVTLTLRIPEAKPKPVTSVPDITKWPEDRIDAMLEGYHLRYGGSSLGQCEGMPVGAVCQNPRPQTQVGWGTAVNRILVPAPPPPQPCSVPHTLSLTANATSLSINEDVRFTAELNPEERAPRYQFFFEDKTASGSLDTGGPIAWHHFVKDGTYTVKAVASIADCELAQSSVEVQVHPISWTVLLEPESTTITPRKTVTFRATVLPSTSEPNDPHYVFLVSGEKAYPPSTDSTTTLPFAKPGTYSVSVVMVDADKHKFRSKPVSVDVVPAPVSTSWPPPMWYVVALSAAVGLGGIGYAGARVLQKLALRKLSADIDQDKSFPRAALQNPGSLVRDILGFRLTAVPVYVESSCRTAIVKKIRKVEKHS